MLTFRNVAVTAVVALAMIGPAQAKSRVVHPGYSARAQAIEEIAPAENGMAAARGNAIRECNVEANRFSQTSWGHAQLDVYRSCMAGRGQAE